MADERMAGSVMNAQVLVCRARGGRARGRKRDFSGQSHLYGPPEANRRNSYSRQGFAALITTAGSSEAGKNPHGRIPSEPGLH